MAYSLSAVLPNFHVTWEVLMGGICRRSQLEGADSLTKYIPILVIFTPNGSAGHIASPGECLAVWGLLNEPYTGIQGHGTLKQASARFHTTETRPAGGFLHCKADKRIRCATIAPT